MNILRELGQVEREELKYQHKDEHLYDSHIACVLDAVHCYQVNIDVADLNQIIILHGLPVVNSTISAAVEYIQENPDFLECERINVLNGVRVQQYLQKLINYQGRLQDCFSGFYGCFMLYRDINPPMPRLEIVDGMHRLVAYGLATKMNVVHFPISIYYGTDLT